MWMQSLKGFPPTPRWVHVTLGLLTGLTFCLLGWAFIFPGAFIKITNPWNQKEWLHLCLWCLMAYSLFVIIWYSAAQLRKKYLLSSGFTSTECEEIFSAREDFNLEKFTQQKDAITLKKVDGFPRKGTHIVTSLFTLLFVTTALEAEANKIIFFSTVGQIISLILSFWSLRRSNLLGFILYGPSSRIRDGRFGRLNMLIVRYTSFLAYLIIGLISARFEDQLTVRERRELVAMVILPTSIGDALGEIIGSVYGRHQFRVIGIGEINKKSLEGTLAVFLGATIPLALWLFISGSMTPLRIGIVFLTIGISSTILELLAPRATDNLVLPLSNLLWGYLFHSIGWLG